ncbi:MAG: Rrf2 family transcriptional regulator [Proteobacteria bacterium]|nr:Rrf2 family transcriptional regulator [Pseudomonadota bacterium]
MYLQLNQRTELAFEALVLLNESDSEYVAGSIIAENVGISAEYLTKVMAPIKRAGWVSSSSGRGGGYRIAIDLTEHCVLDLVEIIEGKVDRSKCMHGDSRNPAKALCDLHVPWVRARDALLNELEMTPLAESSDDKPGACG